MPIRLYQLLLLLYMISISKNAIYRNRQFSTRTERKRYYPPSYHQESYAVSGSIDFNNWPASRKSLNEGNFGESKYLSPQLHDIDEDKDNLDNPYKQQDCSMYPNGTSDAPFAYTCDDGLEFYPPAFVVHDSAMANYTGDYEYPLQFTSPLRIFLDLTSYAIKSFKSMRAEIALYRRKTGWLGCGWIYLPTFGSLDNLEVCEDNDSCPVYPGRQVLELRLEPTPTFIHLLKMVHDDRVPYQMKIRILNNRELGEELLCVVFQARIEL